MADRDPPNISRTPVISVLEGMVVEVLEGVLEGVSICIRGCVIERNERVRGGTLLADRDPPNISRTPVISVLEGMVVEVLEGVLEGRVSNKGV